MKSLPAVHHSYGVKVYPYIDENNRFCCNIAWSSAVPVSNKDVDFVYTEGKWKRIKHTRSGAIKLKKVHKDSSWYLELENAHDAVMKGKVK